MLNRKQSITALGIMLETVIVNGAWRCLSHRASNTPPHGDRWLWKLRIQIWIL